MEQTNLILRIRSNYGQLRMEICPQTETYLDLRKKISNYLLEQGEDVQPKQLTLHLDSLDNEALHFQDSTFIKDIEDIEHGSIIYFKMKREIQIKIYFIQEGNEQSITLLINLKKETLGTFIQKVIEQFKLFGKEVGIFSDALCSQKIEDESSKILQTIPQFIHGANIYVKTQEIKQNLSENQQQQQQQMDQQELYEQLLMQQEGMDEEEIMNMIKQQTQPQEDKMDIEPQSQQYKEQQQSKQNQQAGRQINLRLRTKFGQINQQVDIDRETLYDLKIKISASTDIEPQFISFHIDAPQNPAIQSNDTQYLKEIEGLNEQGELIYVRDNRVLLILVNIENQDRIYEIDQTCKWQQLIDKISQDISIGLGLKNHQIEYQFLDSQNNQIISCFKNDDILQGSQHRVFQHGKHFQIKNIQQISENNTQNSITLRIKSKAGQFNHTFLLSNTLQHIKITVQHSINLEIKDQKLEIQGDNGQVHDLSILQDCTLLNNIPNLSNGSCIHVIDTRLIGYKFQKNDNKLTLELNPKTTTFSDLKAQLSQNFGIKQEDIILSLQKQFNKFIHDDKEHLLDNKNKREEILNSQQLTFSQQNKHFNLAIEKGNILRCQQNLGQEMIAVTNQPLNLNQDFSYGVQLKSKYNQFIGIGFCNLETVKQNQFQFSQQNHGCYILSNQSYVYNHESKHSKLHRPRIQMHQNDYLHIQYNSKEHQIHIKNCITDQSKEQPMQFEVKIPIKNVKQALYPCIVLSTNEVVQIIPNFYENMKYFQSQTNNQILLSHIPTFKLKCTLQVGNKKEILGIQEDFDYSKLQNQQQKDSQIKLKQDNNIEDNMEEEEEKIDFDNDILLRFKSQFGQFRFNLSIKDTKLFQLKQKIIKQCPNLSIKKMKLVLEDSEEENYLNNFPDSTTLKDIDQLENGSLIIIKNPEIHKLKVNYQKFNLTIDIIPQYETMKSLEKKIQEQLKLNNFEINDGLKIDDQLVKNVVSLDETLQIKIIQQDQMEIENTKQVMQNDNIRLRLRSKQGQFNIEVNPKLETIQSLKLKIAEEVDIAIQNIVLYLETEENEIKADQDIPLEALGIIENGSIILIKDINAFVVYFQSVDPKNNQKQGDINKLEIDPNTYTLQQLQNHIINWLGLNKKFTSIHMNDIENVTIEKEISNYMKQQQLTYNQQSNNFVSLNPQHQNNNLGENIMEEEEEEEQEQEESKQDQQQQENNQNTNDLEIDSIEDYRGEQEYSFDDENQQNDLDEDDEDDEDDHDNMENNTQFRNQNLFNPYQNLVNNQQNRNRDQYYNNAFRRLQSQNRSKFGSILISQIPIILKDSVFYAKDNTLTLKLATNDQIIKINPFTSNFRDLQSIIQARLRWRSEYIDVHIDSHQNDPLDYEDDIKVCEIKEIQQNSVIYIKNPQITLRVQYENEEDQYEFFNINLRKQTYLQFKNLVAAWQGISPEDFSLHLDSLQNEEIEAQNQDKIGNLKFIKQLTMTSKIYLKEKEDVQMKFRQKKYNKNQCRLVTENQTRIITKYNEMFFHMRNSITCYRDTFLPSLYESIMAPEQKQVNIPEIAYMQSNKEYKPYELMNSDQKHLQTLGHILAIKFDQEYGLDWGGVTDDFFSLFSTEILDSDKNKFLKFVESNNLIHPTGYQSQGMPQFYQFVGRIFGLMFRHRKNCGVRFHPIFYKMLGLEDKYLSQLNAQVFKQQIQKQKMSIQQDEDNQDSDSSEYEDFELGDIFEITLEDLKEFDIGHFKSLKHYIDNKDSIDWSEQFMNFYIVDQNNQNQLIPLLKDNSDLEVSKDNILQYAQLSIEYYLQIEALKQIVIGFHEVIPPKMLINIGKFKRWESIADLLEGSNIKITSALLQNNVRYEGYQENHKTIRLLWDALENDFSEKERRQLLYYITGKKKLPLNGFKAFKDPKLQKINITYDSHKDRLPEGHTCFHQLILPAYDSKEVLIKKLKMAMKQEAMYIV